MPETVEPVPGSGTPGRIGYRERQSCPAAGAFRLAWTRDISGGSPAPVLALPDGAVDLVWSGDDVMVVGPGRSSTEHEPQTGSMTCGLRFQRGAAAAWLGLPMNELLGWRMPLAQVVGRVRAAEVLEPVRAAADTGLPLAALELAVRGPGDPAGYLFATEAIRLLHSMDASCGLVRILTTASGMSERTLRRRFDQVFGYGPRTLSRILRLERLLLSLEHDAGDTLAAVAIESGYADQAHMSREVRALTSLTPAALKRRQTALARR